MATRARASGSAEVKTAGRSSTGTAAPGPAAAGCGEPDGWVPDGWAAGGVVAGGSATDRPEDPTLSSVAAERGVLALARAARATASATVPPATASRPVVGARCFPRY